MKYILFNFILLAIVYLSLKVFWPAGLQKVKQFYVFIFSTVIRGLKKVVVWNKQFLQHSKDKYSRGNKLVAITYFVGYGFMLVVQLVIAILLFVSYIICKLSGFCMFI